MKTYRLKESIHIDAPLERCFLLSTSIEIVQMTLGMKPVAGKLTGLIVLGDRLLWRGWKFGLPAWHETLITRYERPSFFQDTMGSGMFQHFHHDHRFEFIDGRTLLADVVTFTMPLGPIGNYMAKKVVIPHVLHTMIERFELIKRIAEGTDWQQYLPPEAGTAQDPESDRIQPI
jgi:ligand-binding SRPBCC domain-containing protein